MSARGLPVLLLLVLLSACAPAAASPTPIVTSTSPPAAFTPAPAGTAVSGEFPPTGTPACVDGLSFLQDLTVPDGALFLPGEAIDKRWLVQNTGSCDWGQGYRLRLVDGDALGVPVEMALFPARAGAQAELRIVFSAPTATGTYRSYWQAFDPDGQPFGDIFYMEIQVP